jgi:hypothetical protein
VNRIHLFFLFKQIGQARDILSKADFRES